MNKYICEMAKKWQTNPCNQISITTQYINGIEIKTKPDKCITPHIEPVWSILGMPNPDQRMKEENE